MKVSVRLRRRFIVGVECSLNGSDDEVSHLSIEAKACGDNGLDLSLAIAREADEVSGQGQFDQAADGDSRDNPIDHADLGSLGVAGRKHDYGRNVWHGRGLSHGQSFVGATGLDGRRRAWKWDANEGRYVETESSIPKRSPALDWMAV